MTEHKRSLIRLGASTLVASAIAGIGGTAFAVPSYAATKMFTLSVPETCYNAEFDIECPNDTEHKYSYTLQSPDGAMYTVSWDENNELKQFVGTAQEGNWTVMVSDNMDTTDAAESIGNVKVSVKKNVERSSETTDASTAIAKEISGLRIYFKDSAIVVSWEDEAVGNVNVQVINAKTLEKYFNDTVADKSVEVPVPDGVTDFTVTVVPSTDSSIPGATQSYTYRTPDWFINNTTDSVTFPEYSNTNQVELPFHVETGDSYALEYYINDQRVGGEDMMPAGKYDLKIPISEGTNDIKIYLVDGKGNMKSWSDRVVLDTKAPSLSVDGLQEDASTYDGTITITGQAEDYDQVLLNNEPVEVAFDGTFEVEVALADGANKIQIAAVDVAGNRTEKTATITKLVQEKKSLDSSKLFTLLFGVVACIATFVILKKKKKTKASLVFENSDEEQAEEYMQPNTVKSQMDDSESIIKTDKKHLKKKQSNPKTAAMIRDLITVVIIPIAIVYFLVRVLFLTSVVQSGSMEPTIMTKDIAVGNAVAYKVREPQRGDIVYVKNASTEEKLYVKRIIGMPGETVSFKDGYVYINGQKLDEPYISEDVETNCDKTFEVPEGCYLVLGDNRENSRDSRYWDNPYVKESEIKGKIIMNFPSLF